MANRLSDEYQEHIKQIDNKMHELEIENTRKINEITEYADKKVAEQCKKLMQQYDNAYKEMKAQFIEISNGLSTDLDKQEKLYEENLKERERDYRQIKNEQMIHDDILLKEREKNRKEAENEIKKAENLMVLYEDKQGKDNAIKYIFGYLYPDILFSFINYIKEMKKIYDEKLYQSVIGMGRQLFFVSNVKERELYEAIKTTKKYVQENIICINETKELISMNFSHSSKFEKYTSFNEYYCISPGSITKELMDYWSYGDYDSFCKRVTQEEKYIHNYGNVDENTDEIEFLNQIKLHITNSNCEVSNSIKLGCANIYERVLLLRKAREELDKTIVQYQDEIRLFDERICYEKIISEAFYEYGYETYNKSFIINELGDNDVRLGTSILFINPEDVIVEVCIIKIYVEKKDTYQNQVVVALDVDDLGHLHDAYKADIVSLIKKEPGINTDSIEIKFDRNVPEPDKYNNMIKSVYCTMNGRR